MNFTIHNLGGIISIIGRIRPIKWSLRRTLATLYRLIIHIKKKFHHYYLNSLYENTRLRRPLLLYLWYVIIKYYTWYSMLAYFLSKNSLMSVSARPLTYIKSVDLCLFKVGNAWLINIRASIYDVPSYYKSIKTKPHVIVRVNWDFISQCAVLLIVHDAIALWLDSSLSVYSTSI